MSTTSAGPVGGAATYRRLLGYAGVHWRRLVLAGLCTVVFALTEMGFAALMKPFIDNGLTAGAPYPAWQVPAAVLLLFLLRGVVGFVAAYQMEWVGGRVIAALREALFEHYMVLPSSYFDQRSAGEQVSRLTYNVQMVSNAASKALTVLVRDSVKVVGLLALMGWHSWRLTAVFLLIGPLLALLIVYVSRRFRHISRRIQGAMGELTHVLSEVIEGHREVKIFGAQAQERRRFGALNERNFRLNLKETATRAASTPLIHFLVAVALAVIMYFASLEGSADKLSAGAFVSFLTAMLLLFQPLRSLSELNAVIQRGIAAGESVFATLEQAAEPDTGQRELRAPVGELRYRDVHFRYPGERGAVVRGLSFRAGPGETVALVGPSGGGKSSVVQLLARLYEPQSGVIEIDGVDIRHYTLASLRAQIAYVGQQVTLFNGSIAANIAYGLDGVEAAAIEDAARAANAHGFITAMADGYQTAVGDNGVLLSGGQRQRIAIARALLRPRPLLVLDEATSALDAAAERAVQQGLERLMSGRTTLVIAHHLSTVERADRILVLDGGQVVESGSHAELIARDGHYARLRRLQQMTAERA